MRPLATLRHALPLAILLAAACLGRAAAAQDELYRAQAIVTGEGEAERARGFALCLETVLVKVSGDPRLQGDAAVARLAAQAAGFVAGFAYQDRMAGIPVHDEQGTRERPFDLTVAFEPAKIDAALRTLGRQKWAEPRPRLAMLLDMRDPTNTAYVLAEDGARGLDQRQALAAAAARRGLALRLPNTALLAAHRVTYGGIAAAPAPRLRALARDSGGDALLTGSLVWSDAALGWTARWHLQWRGRERRWHISGVSFDDAFRNAIDGAVAVMSGQP
jgi:uncharacterized protein